MGIEKTCSYPKMWKRLEGSKKAKSSNKDLYSDRITRKYGSIRLVDWCWVTLHKEIKFQFLENSIALLADKAIRYYAPGSLNRTWKGLKPLTEKKLDFFFIRTICTGLALKEVEEWDNSELIETLLNNIIREKNVKIEDLEWYTILSTCSVPLILEVSCLAKMSGHPLIKMKGHIKLYNRVNKEFPVFTEAVGHCLNSTKKSYVLNYLHKHHRWPGCDLDPLAPDMLVQSKKANMSPEAPHLVRLYGAMSDTDWAWIDLHSEEKFSFLANPIALLKDKALSVLRSDVLATYFEHTMKGDSEKTRLLLYFLLTDPINTMHEEFIMNYINDDEEMSLCRDYLVIRLVPKEKELKTAYRGFGVQSYQNRMRCLAQEKMSQEYLHKYSNEQAMTLSELSLMKKLYEFSQMKNQTHGHNVYKICIDVSGWCSMFRSDTVHPVARETLDKIYGTNLAGRTHDSYENARVYIPDELLPVAWDGQLGE